MPGHLCELDLLKMRPEPALTNQLATFDPGNDADRWHERIFLGEIALFDELVSASNLVSVTRGFVEEELAPYPPVEIHKHLDIAKLIQVLSAAQRRYMQLSEVKMAWSEFFYETGIDVTGSARDRLILRFQPPANTIGAPAHHSTATLGLHRDSWATNLYAQVNWWAPVYPVDRGRTLGVYPDLWAHALPNSSADFDLPTVMKRLREEPGSVKTADLIPHLTASIDGLPCKPVLIDPGSVIAFSSQHVHRGIPNLTEWTRISLDTRTIRATDYLVGRGAPNIDGFARWASPGMFRQIEGGRPFPDLIASANFLRYKRPSGN